MSDYSRVVRVGADRHEEPLCVPVNPLFRAYPVDTQTYKMLYATSFPQRDAEHSARCVISHLIRLTTILYNEGLNLVSPYSSPAIAVSPFIQR